jgi:hypothetical protein
MHYPNTSYSFLFELNCQVLISIIFTSEVLADSVREQVVLSGDVLGRRVTMTRVTLKFTRRYACSLQCYAEYH